MKRSRKGNGLGEEKKKWSYDLHIHTALSPCGDESMTPHNIVNMSLLKGLDIIAITDHQTVANCEAVMKVGKEKGLYVIPGIEIECMEEFHMIALFQEIESAKEMEKWLKNYIPSIMNRTDIFGHQYLMDERDECTGEFHNMLLIAAQVSARDIIEKARSLKAVIYPAHIDRKTYSILFNLGSIPEEYMFSILEISQGASYEAYKKKYPSCCIIQSSDAHYLQDIAENHHKITALELEQVGIILND